MLLNRAFRLVRQVLEQHGEFHPFGFALKSDRQIEPVTFQDERGFPPPEDVVKMIQDAFMVSAAKGEVIATALATNVKTTLPAGGQTDAVAVALDHRDNYSIVAFIPYQITDGQLATGVLYTRPGGGGIFPSRQ